MSLDLGQVINANSIFLSDYHIFSDNTDVIELLSILYNPVVLNKVPRKCGFRSQKNVYLLSQAWK